MWSKDKKFAHATGKRVRVLGEGLLHPVTIAICGCCTVFTGEAHYSDDTSSEDMASSSVAHRLLGDRLMGETAAGLNALAMCAGIMRVAEAEQCDRPWYCLYFVPRSKFCLPVLCFPPPFPCLLLFSLVVSLRCIVR